MYKLVFHLPILIDRDGDSGSRRIYRTLSRVQESGFGVRRSGFGMRDLRRPVLLGVLILTGMVALVIMENIHREHDSAPIHSAIGGSTIFSRV